MVNKSELLAWVASLDADDCIGIDEGWLCLHAVGADNTLTGAYYEIGGIPEDVEPDLKAGDMTGVERATFESVCMNETMEGKVCGRPVSADLEGSTLFLCREHAADFFTEG